MATKRTRTPKSDTEAKSRAATGAQSVSVYLLPDERALWDRLAKEAGMSKKDTFMAALRALEGRNGLSRADVLAYLERTLPADTVKLAKGVKVEG